MEYLLKLGDIKYPFIPEAQKPFEALNEFYKDQGLCFDSYGNPIYFPDIDADCNSEKILMTNSNR